MTALTGVSKGGETTRENASCAWFEDWGTNYANYTCNVIKDPINNTNVTFETYSINEKFIPLIPGKLGKNHFLLYTN